MDGILHKTFEVEFQMPSTKQREVEKYLESTVGPRHYYLHSQVGGKNWAVKKSGVGSITICVNDPSLASFIALKFS